MPELCRSSPAELDSLNFFSEINESLRNHCD